MKRLTLLFLAALSLSACVGVDVDWRGWRVRGFAAAPLETPLVQNYEAPRASRVLRETRIIRQNRSCRPPHWLMEEYSYRRDDDVWRSRELQRWVRRNCG